jgi:hypothetical protein
MSYHTPTGFVARATMFDRSAAHQIRLKTIQPDTGRAWQVGLGCSCGWSGGVVTTAEGALTRYRARHHDDQYVRAVEEATRLVRELIAPEIPTVDAGARVVKGAIS